MKAYMMSPAVAPAMNKLMRQGNVTTEDVDRVATPYIVDKEMVEIPVDSRSSDLIKGYRKKGWTLLAVPESSEEVELIRTRFKF